ncbi:MAG: hypothetical protein GF398_15570 [Chitinivibrionales bacterium]|nr:hypothetical protein [Chitinivibrionales bacterium]
MKSIVGICVCLFVPHLLSAENEVPTKEFFDGLEAQFIREYYECTDDERKVDLNIVFIWKKKVEKWQQSINYHEILQKYVQAHDSLQTKVRPCYVYQWIQDLRRKKLEAQRQRYRDSLQRAYARAESLRVARELEQCTSSKYDFSSIPFGVSKETFINLFKRQFEDTLIRSGNMLIAPRFGWGGKPYTLAFRFGSNNRLFQYDIEGRPLSSHYIDNTVRPDATHLAEIMQARLGKPGHRHTIGLYEIVQGRLAPYARWYSEHFLVSVGIATYKYRYYAKAIVRADTYAAKRRHSSNGSK